MYDCAALCDQHGMLIADEVQSGAGRPVRCSAMGTDGRCGRYYQCLRNDRRRLSAGRRYWPGRRDGRYRAGRGLAAPRAGNPIARAAAVLDISSRKIYCKGEYVGKRCAMA